MRRIIHLCSAAIIFYLISIFSFIPTSALTYQSSVDVGFTFNPAIVVNLSGDLLINNLAPGSSADSNIIDVNVSTNASHGYTLVATAGTSTTNTNLVNSSNSSYIFSSIATNADLASLTTDNTWGYSFSTNNGTNWSNYSGLPLDNNDEGATGKELLSTNTPSDNRTIKFKIGAKASIDQAAGTYNNTINFYAITNPVPLSFDEAYAAAGKTKLNGYYKIQDATPSIIADVAEGQISQVIDVRNGTVYNIGKLADGNAWMLDNLSLDLTDSNVQAVLSSSNTNASDTSLNYLINGGGSGQYPATGVSSTFASSNTIPYIEKRYKDDVAPTRYGAGTGKVGIYYNFCSTSGGSYCYSTGSGIPSEDICPSNWSIIRAGDLNNTYTIAYAGNGENFRNAFSANYSGYYYPSGQSGYGTVGEWWTTSFNSTYDVMRGMEIMNSLIHLDNYDGRPNRSVGYNIRCVLHTQ